MTGWLSEFSDPADQANIERLQAPNRPAPKLPAMQGFGEAVKDGTMIGGAGVVRAGQLAGSTVLLAQDYLWGLDPQEDGSAFKEYMDATEPVVESAEDYWKIDSENTGTAGQVAGGLSRIALPMIAGGGASMLAGGSYSALGALGTLAASETAITSTDALDAGATSAQAVGIGLAQGAAVGIGGAIPVAFGKTLVQKVATGALANAGLGVAVRGVQSGIAGDNELLSQMYDPFDGTSLAVDLGIGATFGAIAGLAARRRAAPLDQQDAVAAAEVESSINSSMPNPDARPPEAHAHRTDLDAATRALQEGAPVQPRTVPPEDSAALAAFAEGQDVPAQPILTISGKPFPSEDSAQNVLTYEKRESTHEVRPFNGGYAIFPKADAAPVTPTASSGKVELTDNGQSITIQPTGAAQPAPAQPSVNLPARDRGTSATPAQNPADAPAQPLSPVKQGIATAAEQAGIDPTTALVIGHIETGGRFNADAQNTASTANGLFQVIQSSWKALGGGNRADPAEQIRVGLLHMKEVEGTLTSALGRKPALHESYMGHLLGAGGARIVLTADPNARLYDVVYGYTKAKTEAKRVKIAQDTVNNNGMRGLTVGEAIAKWQAKTDQVATQYRQQSDTSAPTKPAELDAMPTDQQPALVDESPVIDTPDLFGDQQSRVDTQPVAPVDVAPPVRSVMDGDITLSTGLPFDTVRDARKAIKSQKLGDGYSVQEVDNGYVVRKIEPQPQPQPNKVELTADNPTVTITPDGTAPRQPQSQNQQVIVADNGKPYASALAAESAIVDRGIKDTHRVQEVDGGHVIVPKNPEPTTVQPTPRATAEPVSQPSQAATQQTKPTSQPDAQPVQQMAAEQTASPTDAPNSAATPEQSAAQAALIDNDVEMPTGELDADGNPIMMSGRDALALIEQETATVQEQTAATQAAVSCALSRGL